METKYLELKAVMTEDEPGYIEGHGAVTGNVDHGGDMIERGAFKNLDEFVKSGHLLVGHNYDKIGVATIELAYEDQNGLFFRAQWHTDEESQAIRRRVKERMERNKSVGLSIGYMIIDAAYETREGREVRVLKSLDTFEISLAAVPMNPLAGVTGAKTFLQRYEDALACVTGVIYDLREIKDLKAKDGKGWPSKTKRSQITELVAMLSALLEDPKTAPETDDSDLRAEFNRLYAECLMTGNR